MNSTANANYARQERSHALAPGLFAPVYHGLRGKKTAGRTVKSQRPALNVEYEYGDTKIRWYGPAQLGGDDLRVMQVVMALHSLNGKKLHLNSTNHIKRELATAIGLRDDEVGAYIKTNRTEFLRTGRWTGKVENWQTVLRSLERIYCISVVFQRQDERWTPGWRLLAYRYNMESEEITIAVNPRLANAAFGEPGSYCIIDLNEAAQLSTELERIIHQRLSAWVDKGKTDRINLDKLVNRIYGDESDTPEAKRQRRRRVRLALVAIGEKQNGWNIKIEGHLVTVNRTKNNVSNCHASANDCHAGASDCHASANDCHAPPAAIAHPAQLYSGFVYPL